MQIQKQHGLKVGLMKMKTETAWIQIRVVLRMESTLTFMQTLRNGMVGNPGFWKNKIINFFYKII